MTKLTGSLPQGDGNGLDAISRNLIDQPREIHVVIALIDCKKTTTDNDTGAIEPTARIRRIEPIEGDDKELAAKMLRRALERRTGQAVLPFDLEEDLRSVFRDFDPGTGEIRGE